MGCFDLAMSDVIVLPTFKRDNLNFGQNGTRLRNVALWRRQPPA